MIEMKVEANSKHSGQFQMQLINTKYDLYIITTLRDCFGRKDQLNNAYELILEYEKYKNENNNINDILMRKSLSNGTKYIVKWDKNLII